MYVCVCNAVTESDIHEAVANGARNIKQLSHATGCSKTCGSCKQSALDVLEQALSEDRVTSNLLPFFQMA